MSELKSARHFNATSATPSTTEGKLQQRVHFANEDFALPEPASQHEAEPRSILWALISVALVLVVLLACWEWGSHG